MSNTEMTHTQAVHRMKDIQDELERLHAKGEAAPLSAEDGTYWEELVTENGELETHVKKIERNEDLKQVRNAVAAAPRSGFRIERGTEQGSDGGELDRDILGDPSSVEERKFRNPWDLSQVRTFNRSVEEVGAEIRSRALSAIEIAPGMNASRREAATNIIETFDNARGDISQMALYTSSPIYVRAFNKAAAGMANTFTVEEQEAVSRAMSLTDAAGGYLVPFQLDPTVIITSAGTRNDIRQVARQVVATGDTWNGVSSAAVSWSWDAEAAEVSDDATTFAQPSIPIYKGAGFVPISQEALADEANVAAEVGKLLLFGKETLERTAFATGSGSAQPTGIITALTGSGSEINAATDDTFAIADVYSTQGGLPARYREQASWLANNSIYNLVRRFDTSGGAGLWTTLGNDRPAELLGRRALEAEAMDSTVTTTGAVSNYILVFGDFGSGYVIADRIGVTVNFIPQLFHTGNNRPSGSSAWYATFRMGADSVNDDAFRMLDVPSAS